MGDILRIQFPGLTPVPGGSDRGFDGAIPDREGEPFPLICTTASKFSRVKANLVESLASYKTDAGFRGKAVFATSFSLTPNQRRILYQVARAADTTLIQIVERAGVANLLYHSADWCKELLKLTGEPPALSAVPDSARTFLPADLIGRDNDLRWLRTVAGDRLVVGQPGSGKTFLLRKLAEDGGVRFVNSDDAVAIAGELRADDRPHTVIVDDAHVHRERVEVLRRLRGDGHEFAIIATCWPREEDQIAHLLEDLPQERIRCLEPLSRDEIVGLLQQLGVNAKPAVLRHLVDQSANKPGLAVTLARSWLDGDRYAVLDGEILRRTVVGSLTARVGPDIGELLAAFALGGDGGMTVEAVAQHLGGTAREVWMEATELSHGGVLIEVDVDTLCVVPALLRTALLRRAFFPSNDTTRLRRSPRELLSRAPNIAAAAIEVIRCARFGGSVVGTDLLDLVRRAQTEEPTRSLPVWREMAAFGDRGAQWVLEQFPGDVQRVARETIRNAEAPTIDRLLVRAAKDLTTNRNPLDNPLAVVSEWVRDLDVPVDELLRRRRTLVRQIAQFADGGGDVEITSRVIFLALDPYVEHNEVDPGLGNTLTWQHALLPAPAIERLIGLWSEVRARITELRTVWPQLSELLWRCAQHGVTKETEEGAEGRGAARLALRELGRTVLRDLAPLADGAPGYAERLVEFGETLDLSLTQLPDATFETLFPKDDADQDVASQEPGIRALAAAWSAREASEVAADVQRYAQQQHVSARRANLLPLLCREIASTVSDPVEWAGALLQGE